MFNWLKLIDYSHSGKIRPHEHTSYLSLGFLLLIVGLVLAVYTAYASTPYDGPESSSVSLTGIMPGNPPDTAATISIPTSGKHFPTSPITVSGACSKDTLVEIYKNDIFAGSTMCLDSETYALDIDLMIGKNTIIARVYDALNQPGPDSNSVIIYYDALPAQADPLSPLGLNGVQMLLNTDAAFRGVFPEQELQIPIDILGGKPPYAVNIQWGDSNNKVISRNDNTTFKASHIYLKAGTYQVTIQASDSEGRVAFLTVASIVNGQPNIASNTATFSETTNKLLVLWPLYAGSVAVLISFFVGERREKHMLIKRGLLAP